MLDHRPTCSLVVSHLLTSVLVADSSHLRGTVEIGTIASSTVSNSYES